MKLHLHPLVTGCETVYVLIWDSLILKFNLCSIRTWSCWVWAGSRDHSRLCKRDTEKENRSRNEEALLPHQHYLEETICLRAPCHENTVSMKNASGYSQQVLIMFLYCCFTDHLKRTRPNPYTAKEVSSPSQAPRPLKAQEITFMHVSKGLGPSTVWHSFWFLSYNPIQLILGVFFYG